MTLLELQAQLQDIERTHGGTVRVIIRADTRSDDVPSRFDPYSLRHIADVWYHPDMAAVIIDEEEK